MHSLKKHPLFDSDLEAAALRYGPRNPAVAACLIDEAVIAIRTVAAAPLRYSVWRGETRRVRLHRFPHLVFYEFHDDTIYLLAIAHGARGLPALLNERRPNG
jgi:plasmid stabilization system protein ParE